ncbi:sodium:alanine symporter family protein [Coraliomargarita algicola]|uniref:Sodium:alanine symporter family protein n=1 Tax=Coraliomargarita algicola TaxID=3092156 RepID=A0ABZ0RER2_9BACT|nr:sodium:alanine symporter family protein [Coraliomargarita sp. J2-16]WPJ94649.1 sodium:alanine symporter family protein [Coraliomargarita sp. J2-16]
MIDDLLSKLNGLVWGPFMLTLILGTGIYLTIRLRCMPWLKLAASFKLLWKGRQSHSSAGEISPFNALMTSLSATMGTGNIAGVATAIALGGPGAMFWMWLTALVGMATKYAEAVLAVEYREQTDSGRYVGGPMYYIRNGLGKKWTWLAVAFSFFGAIAGFGIGNTVQSHSVADALYTSLNIPVEATGLVLMCLVGFVILGGVKRVAAVAGKLVPIMALSYLALGIAIIVIHIAQVPEMIGLILKSAFTGHAAAGGFTGAAMMAAIRFGVARGVFSNEAGLGSAPIAHAHAQTNSPRQQGMIAMLGTFIDTIVICSMTGFAILLTGVWTSGESGAPLTSAAFETAFPGVGQLIVSISLATFAFTTLIGWSVYGERCVHYLFGEKSIWPFRILWTVAVPIGVLMELDFVWLMADTFNALMAIPNLIALLALSAVVVKITNASSNDKKALPNQ